MAIEYDSTAGDKVTKSYLDPDTLVTFSSTDTSDTDFPYQKTEM